MDMKKSKVSPGRSERLGHVGVVKNMGAKHAGPQQGSSALGGKKK
jgi:hypothetical protein